MCIDEDGLLRGLLFSLLFFWFYSLASIFAVPSSLKVSIDQIVCYFFTSRAKGTNSNHQSNRVFLARMEDMFLAIDSGLN